MKGGALWVWVLVFALLGAYALALPTALYAEGDTASSTPSEPTGVLLDSSYIDSSWNISVYGGGHYVYFLDGYTTIGNPPTATGRGWVTTGTVTTARIKTTPGTPCDQFRWGGTYGLILTADDMTTSYASNPSYTRAVGDDLCEFKFTTPIPSGTRISVAFLGLMGTAEIMGSSQNPGTSLTGTYENPVSGGFALQLCGADGCAGGFTLPPAPTATTTPEIPPANPEETASSTPPTPDPEETASSTPPVTETEESATTTPEVPTEPEVTTPPERSHGGGGRNPSKIPDPIVPEVVTPPTTVAVAETSEAQAPVRAPRRAAAAPLATAAVATSTPTQAVVATTTTTAQIVIQDPPEQAEAPSDALMAGVGAALPAGTDPSVLLYIPLLLAVLLLLILIIRLIQDMVREARAEQHERQAYQYHYNT